MRVLMPLFEGMEVRPGLHQLVQGRAVLQAQDQGHEVVVLTDSKVRQVTRA